MKLCRFGPPGTERPGLIDADGRVRDLSGHLADLDGEALSPDSLARLARIDPRSLPIVPEGVRLGAPIARISKVVGVGMNYHGHASAAGVPVPKRPVLFLKPSNTVAGPFDDTRLPPGAERLDWEVELGVVIGRVARGVSAAQAMDVVAGFTIVDDLTERGWIAETNQLADGKSADGMTPIGPWLVTRDEVPDWRALRLELSLNGEVRQQGVAADMIFDLPTLIERITARTTLLPGDVIATGTPAGIGHRADPPRYLRPGDTLRLSIDGLGEQLRTVRAPA